MKEQKLRRLKLFALILPSGLLAVVLLIIGGIWLFRRPITISLIERVNENIPGTIFIGDGNLNWDHFFTRLSLRLDDTVLADKNGSELLRAGEISFEVNPAALLLGKIDVDSLVLADMDILLELDDSGRLILLDSLGIGAAGKSKNNGLRKSWSVDLRGIHLDNCRVALSKKMGSASVLLEYLDLSFVRNEADGMIDLTLAFSDIHSEGLGPGLFRGKRFQLKLGIDVNNGVAVLNSGSLDVQDARITIAGQTALFPPYKADLILEARGADTDLLLSFLPEGVVLGEVIPEGNGEITVDGYLEGELFNRPDIKLDIVCSNFSLKHVPSGMVMDDIEFELFAFRQNRGPYSFGLRDLNLIFPDGAVHGDISLENPKEPLLMVDIEAGFDISTLSSFFVFPGSKTVQGILDLDVDVFGRFDKNGRLLVRERESGELLLSNFRYIIPGGKSGIQNMNLLLSLEDGYLNINSLDALTDFGEMSLSGSFGDIWPLILRGNGPVHCGLNFTSAVIQPGELFKDPLVAAKWGNELKDISLDLIFDSTAEALRKANPLPEGSYRIADFNVRIPDTGKNLRDFSGGIELSNGLMADLQGRFQDSDVSLEIGLDGYEYLFKGDEEGEVHSSVLLKSTDFTPVDFLPGSTSPDESWLNRSMKDVFLDLDLSFYNSSWFASPGGWPEGKWILNEFSGFSQHKKMNFYTDFNLISENNRAELLSFSIHAGESGITASGVLNNLQAILTRELDKISGAISINSEYLDMSDFIDTREDSESSSVEWEIGGGTYPDVMLDMHVSDFRMSPYKWKNIIGKMGLSSLGLLTLDDLSLSGDTGGRTGVKGTVDLSRTDGIHLNANVDISDMRLEDSMIPMKAGDEIMTLGNVIKGTLNGSAELDVMVNPDLSIDLSRSVIDVNAVLEEGRLVEFPPFVAIADRYKNGNLRDVRLDTLSLRVDVTGGQINIPWTQVGSTLGYLELEGYSKLGSFMSYSVTVPNSVIDDVVSGFILGSRSDHGEDEIISSDNSSRSRTTVNVVGGSEDILINLGKRGRERLEDRWNRRNDRRIRREG